ncbi:MAG TPA: hypothetical protein VEB59_04595, partial [Gemmatimonadales bacterium]|nr:hypothetical protein [Gemmatimonadales bacterium]
MRLEHVFPLEDPAVELPWGLSRSGAEALLRSAETGALAGGRLRVRCRLLGGLTTMVDFHFGEAGQRRLTRVEIERWPGRRKRREFDDLQRRLELWLGPAEPVAPDPAAKRSDIAPRAWRIGKLLATHAIETRPAASERVVFEWS